MTNQRIFDISLKTFLFLSPLFFFSDYHLSFARGLFFIFASIVLFFVSLGCEPKRKFQNNYLVLIGLLAMVRAFLDNGKGAGQWFNFWLASGGFFYVFAGIMLFYVIFTYADNIKQYLLPILLAVIANSILALAQYLNCDFMWHQAPSICGFMENSSQLGQYSAMAMPIVLFIHPVLTIIPAISLFLAKSVSPIFALLCAGCAWIWYSRHSKMWIVLLIVIMELLFFFNFNYVKTKFECRPIIWRKTLSVALKHPYLGTGYRSFSKEVLSDKSNASWGKIEYPRAHNVYLHTAQEIGFPIVVFIMLFLGNMFNKFIHLQSKDKLTLALMFSVLIMLVNMAGQTSIRYASVAGTFISLLALFCARMEDKYAGGF